MSCMTIKYKNTPIVVEFAWYCQTDHIDIESMEIGGVDVQYLLDSLDEHIELKSLIREQIFYDL